MSVLKLFCTLLLLTLSFLGYGVLLAINHVQTDRRISRAISCLQQQERDSSLPYFVQHILFGTLPQQPEPVNIFTSLGHCISSPVVCRRELIEKQKLTLELELMYVDREMIVTIFITFMFIALFAVLINSSCLMYTYASQWFDDKFIFNYFEYKDACSSPNCGLNNFPEISNSHPEFKEFCRYTFGNTLPACAACRINASSDLQPEVTNANETSSLSWYRTSYNAFDDDFDPEYEEFLPLYNDSDDDSVSDESASIQDLVAQLQNHLISEAQPKQDATNSFRKTPVAIHKPKDLWKIQRPSPAEQ